MVKQQDKERNGKKKTVEMFKNSTGQKKGKNQFKWKENREGEWKCSKANARKHCLIEKSLFTKEGTFFSMYSCSVFNIKAILLDNIQAIETCLNSSCQS